MTNHQSLIINHQSPTTNYKFTGGVVEFSIANVLVLVAFVLLVTVTGGVAYLTAVEWGDRRRLDEAKRKKK
ncbi:hypothetical protein [Tychonema sp. BBK16]|uniref:hypothetical protein n=1 Tax=Tychonema sp. BBK16 TaxID=2699888 RepID=UPI001F486E38|nr:hypothetical protein [Tychonema sp. BBK16]MCF6372701.1 hypothetical protein [Tychonema sp. BBK16]